MTTPHVEKLGLIGPWAPAAHDAISDGLDRVAQHLETVAMRTRSIAGELGFEGQMADTTRENLDKLQARVVEHSDGIKRVSTARRQVVEVGRQAQFQYGEIRRNVDAANAARDSAVALAPAAGPVAAPMIVAHANAVHQAAMGVLDVQALAVLKGLDVNTFDAMGKLPPFAQLEGLKQEVESKLKVKLPSVQEVQDAFQKFDQAVKLFNQVKSFFTPPASLEPTAATAPTRSATEWHSGPRMDGGGLSLQSSHYSMPSVQAGHAVSQPSMLHSPAVFNPMATAAAATGGAAAASYKLYQAAKAAQMVSAPQSASSALRSGATMRVQSPGSGSGILRGTTTAARAEASATASRGLGGASGAARPTSGSSSSQMSGIMRGATTAPRAKTSKRKRREGIKRRAATVGGKIMIIDVASMIGAAPPPESSGILRRVMGYRENDSAQGTQSSGIEGLLPLEKESTTYGIGRATAFLESRKQEDSKEQGGSQLSLFGHRVARGASRTDEDAC